MARLIDADALKHEISGSIPMMPTIRISIEYKIDGVPTIDAIPVEWLKDKRDKEVDILMQNIYGRGNVETVHAINDVLEMWQKEQEGE